jgi:chemotaxis protein CheC
MSTPAYSQDETDALQEVVNIAMGQAGDSLARILEHFVRLSIPRIRLVSVEQLIQTVHEMVATDEDVSAVRQAVYNHLRGEAIVIFTQLGCKHIADLMGYEDGELDSLAEQEVLLDVSNLLVGAILNGISETLEMDLAFSAPSLMAQRQPIKTILNTDTLSWTHALLLEVNFSLENRDFKCHLLLFMTEETIGKLKVLLEDFMDDI